MNNKMHPWSNHYASNFSAPTLLVVLQPIRLTPNLNRRKRSHDPHTLQIWSLLLRKFHAVILSRASYFSLCRLKFLDDFIRLVYHTSHVRYVVHVLPADTFKPPSQNIVIISLSAQMLKHANVVLIRSQHINKWKLSWIINFCLYFTLSFTPEHVLSAFLPSLLWYTEYDVNGGAGEHVRYCWDFFLSFFYINFLQGKWPILLALLFVNVLRQKKSQYRHLDFAGTQKPTGLYLYTEYWWKNTGCFYTTKQEK